MDIILKAKEYPHVAKYLPDENDFGKLPRQWIINVVFSLVGQPFSEWVSSNI